MDFSRQRFVLDQWTVDPVAGELTADHGKVVRRVGPKPVRVLALLAQAGGEVVSTQRIVDEVWGAHYVGETPVANAISRLRTALGDSASNPRYIQTIQGVGYRLLCSVAPEPGDPDTPEDPAPGAAPLAAPTRGRRRKHLAFVCYSKENSAAALWLAKQLRRAAHPLGPRSIFVDDEAAWTTHDLKEIFKRELDASRHLIVCLSEAAGQAEFVRWELETFLAHSSVERVALVRVGDDDLDIQHSSVFPERIRPEVGSNQPLPIVDLRGDPGTWSEETLDARRTAVDKLLAAMHGFRYVKDYRLQRRLARGGIWGAVAAGVVAAALTLFQLMPSGPTTVAAVPFAYEPGEQRNEALGRSLARDVLSHLIDVPDLNVISDSVSFSQMNEERGLLALSELIGANYIIDGRVTERAGQISVAIFIVDAKTALVKEDGEFTRSTDERNELGAEIAVAIADWLGFGTPFKKVTRLIQPDTDSAEAYRFYHAGLEFLKSTNERSNLGYAIERFEGAIRADGRYAAAYAGSCEAHIRLYIVTRDEALYNKASERCNRALVLDRELPQSRISAGILYRESDKLAESETLLESVLAEQPNNVDVMIELADTYAVGRRLEEAENTLREAIELQPGYWESYSALGYFLYEYKGDYEQALENFLWVTQLKPDGAIAYANAGAAYYLLDDTDNASKALDRSIELEPLGFALITRGLIAYYDGDFALAADSYEAALKLDEGDYQVWALFGEASRRVPERAASADDALRRAVSLAEERVNINSADAFALARLGLLHARLGDFTAAHARIAQAHAVSPDDMDVYHQEAAVWAEQGNTARMCASLDRAIALGFDEKSIANDPDFEAYPDACP